MAVAKKAANKTVTKKAKAEAVSTCEICHGSGLVDKFTLCETCSGSGTV